MKFDVKRKGVKQKLKITGSLFIALLGYSSSIFATELPDFPFIAAVGEVKISAPTDLAIITIDAVSFEQPSEKTLEMAVKASEEILVVLEKHGLGAASIKSSDLRKTKKRNLGKSYESLELPGYSVSPYFTIKTSNVSQHSQITRELTRLKSVVAVSAISQVYNPKNFLSAFRAESYVG